MLINFVVYFRGNLSTSKSYITFNGFTAWGHRAEQGERILKLCSKIAINFNKLCKPYNMTLWNSVAADRRTFFCDLRGPELNRGRVTNQGL